MTRTIGYYSTLTSEAVANNNGDNNDNGADNNNPGTNGIVSSGITLSLGAEPTNDGDSANANSTLDFGFVQFDWGDAPASYGTSDPNGASHVIVAGYGLGILTDDEGDGQPNATATGDDSTGSDDEDGVTFATPLVAGHTALITVTAQANGTLNAWVDFNGDGDFDALEQIATNLALVAGDNSMVIPVPANAVGTMVSRFRYTGGTGEVSGPLGRATNGEVEDYVLAALGNFVWHDSNANGRQDNGEPGLNGVVVRLLDGNSNPLRDGDGNEITIITGNNPVGGAAGWYEFAGLTPGNYRVQFVAPAGELFTFPDASGTNETNDSDANRTTGITLAVNLGVGETNNDLDAGLVLTVTVGDRVWYDTNGDGLQGAVIDELGVPDIGVTLYYTVAGSSQDVGTTTTNANGIYTFTNLTPGQYYVVFDLTTLPINYKPTYANQGGDDNVDSDVYANTGQTPTFGFLVSGATNTTLDMGLVASVRVGNYVWYDMNGDGLQGSASAEPGVPEVGVSLYISQTLIPGLSAGELYSTTTTDASGQYTFTDLPPGAYYLVFDLTTLPSTYRPTGRNVGSNDNVDSDANTSGQTPSSRFLFANQQNLTLDMGIVADVTVGDRVWYDNNGNGVQGDSVDEPGVPNIGVSLYYSVAGSSTLSGTTVTDGTGNYLFDDLPPGNYYVVFNLPTLPAGYTPTLPDRGNNDNLDSDANSDGRSSESPFLFATDSNITLDMGIVAPVTVGNRVWLDVDGDGRQDSESSEAGVPDVGVSLYNTVAGSSTLRSIATTDASGLYTFTNLPPGDYYVIFDLTSLPTGYVVTQQNQGTDTLDNDADGVTGETASTGFLFSTDSDTTLDMGLYLPINLGDHVWYDNNGDGLQGAPDDEPGVPNIGVSLYVTLAGSSELLTGTTTDASGNYTFTNLSPGNYYVFFDLTTLPANYAATFANLGGNENVDSDAEPTTGVTAETGFLESGAVLRSLDMGIVAPVTVGDYVWLDLNGDGIQGDASDEPGVENVGVSLYISQTFIPGLSAGELYSMTTTNASGQYTFSNLPPGAYYFVFDLTSVPSAFRATEANLGGDDSLDSDANASGQTPSSGFIFANEQNLTVDMGLVADVTVGDRVWFDVNGDGIQGNHNDEPGVLNVGVSLYASGSGSSLPISTTTTDVFGFYAFKSMPPGNYYVVFDLATLPPGYAPTLANVEDDSTDSDVDAGSDSNGKTEESGFLFATESNLTLDLGIVAPVSVGDRVWLDANGDSVQGDYVNEPGIANVVVDLYHVVAGSGTFSGTMATDSSGFYTFTNLMPGEYYVVFNLATLPAGHVATFPNMGEDSVDSDADRTTGQTPSTGFLLATQSNLTLDLGIYAPVSIGDYGWYDLNGNGQQDVDELALVGLVVRLYYSNGDPVLVGPVLIGEETYTVTTNEFGRYLFENLPPAAYFVVFDIGTLPSGYVPTLPNIGSDGLDSDGDPTTGQSATTRLLTSGSQDATLDLGVVAAGVEIIKYTNGENADGATGPYINNGDAVVWRYVITNTGQITLTNVVITDSVIAGDLCSYPELGPGASEICEIQGLATAGQYANIGYVQGTPLTGAEVRDSDSSHYFGQTPGIVIKKYTNGEDGESEPGPFVALGSKVVWTYIVTNTSNVNLTNVVITDSVIAGILCAFDQVEPGVSQACQVTGTATAGQYANVGYVKGTPPSGSDAVDNDVSHYFGQIPAIELKKYTNGEDADSGTGPFILVGQKVKWTYVATNIGNVTLTNVQITDDRVALTNCPAVTLAPGASTVCEETGIATADQYANLGTVTGTPPVGEDVRDDNLSSYFGQLPGGIEIKKYTNGVDADIAPGPALAVGQTVTWTYVVTNSSNVTLTNVSITDDMIPNLNCPHVTLLQGASLTCTFTGTAGVGQYVNIGTVKGTPPSGPERVSQDPSYYFGQPVGVGSYVWYDNNGDGQQGNLTDEPRAQGVVTHLFDAASNQPILQNSSSMSETTDVNGFYLFTGLPPGNYYVNFDLSTLPAGYRPTTEHVGLVDTDSDADGEGRTQDTGFLEKGGQDLSMDMGIVASVTVGDYVWYDNNGDGQQGDAEDEPGVPNVLVTLYDAVSGQPVRVDNQPLTDSTDANGLYLFQGLQPGNYYVVFDLATLPVGYTVTAPNVGDDATDSDGDVGGRTANTVLLLSNQQNLTLDLGIYLPVSVGDFVWYDNNGDGLQTTDEPGVPGVVASLYDAVSGQPILWHGQPISATTNTAGYYLFQTLPVGNYFVVFDMNTMPIGYGPTVAHQGANDQVDSDVDEVEGQWRTGNTRQLVGGEANLALDMGINRVNLQLVKRANVTQVQVGSLISYTLVYTNIGGGVAIGSYIDEVIPLNTIYTTVGSSPGWNCEEGAVGGSRCRIELGTLQYNQSGMVTIAVRVMNTFPIIVGSIQNSAVIGNDQGEQDSTIPDNTSDHEIEVTAPSTEEPTEQPSAPPDGIRIYMPEIKS